MGNAALPRIYGIRPSGASPPICTSLISRAKLSHFTAPIHTAHSHQPFTSHSHLPFTPPIHTSHSHLLQGEEKEKKVKKLQKALRQVEELKAKVAAGIALEKTQLQKLGRCRL